jgi:two-component system, OmpR family, sensor kinase
VSIRLRLALWYGLLTGTVVLLVGAITYSIHTRAHYDDTDRSLVDSATHVLAEYRTAGTPEEATAAINLPVSASIAIRVDDAAGRLIAGSAGASLAPMVDPAAVLRRGSQPAYDALAGLAPALLPVPPDAGTFALADGPGGRWRIFVLSAGVRDEILVAALPLDHLDAATDRFRVLVIVFSGLGALVTVIAGRLLAGRALRPVATLTATAAAIAGSHTFAQRVSTAEDGRDELHQLGATFNTMLDSLQAAYQAQQRFVSDASHELRAPLTAMQGNLELLLRRGDAMTAVEGQEALTEAGREAARMARLIADLLAMARADAGVPMRREPVELDRVVLDALAEARRLARGHALELGSFQPMQVVGDEDRLKQLLLIVLDNALKYTPAGGTVTVELVKFDSSAQIQIQDTGIGIATADLPHVFDRFYRADQGRGRDPGGTGLGLPIARWIVDEHNGTITLTSEAGRGTTVTIRLPLKS